MANNIHQTAIIEHGAEIGDNVEVGAYSCIGSNVKIGNNVKIYSHVVIAEDTTVGDEVVIYPFASLGQKPQDLKYRGEKSSLTIGKKTVIREYVTANIGTAGGGMITSIGENCLIMAYCHIAHDCRIGDNVILVNGVNLAGHVTIGNNAIIGGMSAVKQFIRIGNNAMIGGCTGVDRDIIPYGIARSVRTTSLKGLNIIGLRRAGFSNEEIEQMQDVYNYIFIQKEDNKTTHEKLDEIRTIYKDNKNIQEIIDFISKNRRNQICTPIPTDVE